MKPFICLITGPAGVGKSTIAELLVKKFAKTALVDVDYIRHAVKNGYKKPYPHTKEIERQIFLAAKNAIALAKNFNDAGFSVVIDDVVTGEKKLNYYISQTKGYNFFVFLLMCDKNILKQRDRGRPKGEQMGVRALQLHEEFAKRLKEDKWTVINTNSKTQKETLREILKTIYQK